MAKLKTFVSWTLYTLKIHNSNQILAIKGIYTESVLQQNYVTTFRVYSGPPSRQIKLGGGLYSFLLWPELQEKTRLT